jgi:hypothetical protein
MPVLLGDVLLFFLLGCMGRWDGDRDCQPSELTVVCPLGWKLLAAYRAQNSRFGCQPLPRRGFDLRAGPSFYVLLSRPLIGARRRLQGAHQPR